MQLKKGDTVIFKNLTKNPRFEHLDNKSGMVTGEAMMNKFVVKIDGFSIMAHSSLLTFVSHEKKMPDEFEELYNQMAEDWHVWDESEKGIYPVQRVFDAMKKFMEKQKYNK